MDVNVILELLDDSQVQEKIKSIIIGNKNDSKRFVSNQNGTSNVEVDNDCLVRENQILKKESEEMQGFIKKLKALLLGKDNEITDNISKIEILESKIDSLQHLAKEKELKEKQKPKEDGASKQESLSFSSVPRFTSCVAFGMTNLRV